MPKASRQSNRNARFKYFHLLIEALLAHGSSATPPEVYRWIEKNGRFPSEKLEETTRNGALKYVTETRFARHYLTRTGYIVVPERGLWVLTEKGKKENLSNDKIKEIYTSVYKEDRKRKRKRSSYGSVDVSTDPASVPDETQYTNQSKAQEILTKKLRSITAKGFEEFCARLLRRLGYVNIKLTGKSNDKGIDGVGDLQINQFARMKVMFQCKRYNKLVTPDKVREFVGAYSNKAERGIFFTTARFTSNAREIADENNTLELVDIDRLLELMIEEKLGVGVKVVEVRELEVDNDFFDEYK